MTIGTGLPPPYALFTDLIGELSKAAVEHSGKISRRRKAAQKTRVGAKRKPGADTPLWNAVVRRVQPHLTQYGAKSNLARVLGIPRQRVYDYFTRLNRMPEAECVLHILLWLAEEESRLTPGRHAQPLR